ncbi:mitochondrial dicarboxylate carrier [Brachionus plicatilis]|uniref:Mitochondrial dicarboxylate carrier n=1 Tax=Brachionus plicatilis TaxID=10195 RepID=A0A3M7S3J0_BRAPC|nr:mitochondrial dicarboxylate carrier [Brachionus plicatilis]
MKKIQISIENMKYFLTSMGATCLTHPLDTIKVQLQTQKKLKHGFSLGGGIGSIVGSLGDLINVRMQNDSKLTLEKRGNYNNCFEALYRITKIEGFTTLYTGFHISAVRGVLVTVASMCAGFIATLITMPVDVIKTLLMDAKTGELNGILHTSREILKYDKLPYFAEYKRVLNISGPLIFEKIHIITSFYSNKKSKF